MNKQAVRVLYVDLLYSYELIRMDLPLFFFSGLNPPDDWIYLPTSGLAYPHEFCNKGRVRFATKKFALEVIIQVARYLGTKYLVDTNKIFF